MEEVMEKRRNKSEVFRSLRNESMTMGDFVPPMRRNFETSKSFEMEYSRSLSSYMSSVVGARDVNEQSYLNYIAAHREAVMDFWTEVQKEIEALPICIENITRRIRHHDMSKYSTSEFLTYRRYFYGKDGSKETSRDAFMKSFKHHYEVNDHHWEHWLMDGKPCVMEINSIIEMLCDWSAKNLKYQSSVKDWYEFEISPKGRMTLNERTKKLVDELIPLFEKKLMSLIDRDGRVDPSQNKFLKNL